jgi:hypothetical protein
VQPSEATQFSVMRFLLGMAEARFFPAAIFYLMQMVPRGVSRTRNQPFLFCLSPQRRCDGRARRPTMKTAVADATSDLSRNLLWDLRIVFSLLDKLRIRAVGVAEPALSD